MCVAPFSLDYAGHISRFHLLVQIKLLSTQKKVFTKPVDPRSDKCFDSLSVPTICLYPFQAIDEVLWWVNHTL